jgi:transcriptional regulator with XRE-family HTH domain
MKATELKLIRSALGLTQAQFAQLLGVHEITVSKWERGQGAPSPYQQALIQSFSKAQKQSPDVGSAVAGLLVAAGIGAALFYLLKAAFEGNGSKGS